MTDEHVFRGQGGQHINKTEQLNLKVLIVHAPVHDLTDPPVLVEDGGTLAANHFKKRLAAIDNPGFYRCPVQIRRSTVACALVHWGLAHRFNAVLLLICTGFQGHLSLRPSVIVAGQYSILGHRVCHFLSTKAVITWLSAISTPLRPGIGMLSQYPRSRGGSRYARLCHFIGWNFLADFWLCNPPGVCSR